MFVRFKWYCLVTAVLFLIHGQAFAGEFENFCKDSYKHNEFCPAICSPSLVRAV